MPCSFRRGFLRFIMPSISIRQILSTATSVCGASAVFHKLKSAHPFRILVIAVQWIAARWQAVPGRSRAITESPANGLVFGRLSTRSMPEQFGISEHHSSHPYTVCPPFTNRGVSYIRQKVLEITVCRSHNNQLWKMLLEAPRNAYLSGHSGKRILRRLITV